MTRKEFHRLYEQAPEELKAELIGGVVHMPSPLRIRHAKNHPPFSALFFHYESSTPGVECGDNATILLGEDGEPQPDLYLRILPEYGGHSRTTLDDYVEGPPELVAEIAHSSRAIDLYEKKDDYRRYGVMEYLVYCVQEPEIRWFDLRCDEEKRTKDEGILRLETFPGLWLDSAALFSRNGKQLLATLAQGLATTEHSEFVQRLARARSEIKPE
jgi:Uma2 family endonuclease